MTKNPFAKQQKLRETAGREVQSPYQRLYGLRENPFPSMGLFVASESDPRRNGTIYDPEFRIEEEKYFFDKFVQPVTREEPIRLGFVRVDPEAGGRGNGKSSFLNRMMHRINEQDWSDWPSDPDAADLNALAVHLLPEPRVQSNVFALVKLLLETLERRGIMAKKIDPDLRAAILYGLLDEDQIEELAQRPADEVEADLASHDRFVLLLERYDLSMDAFIEAAEQRIAAIDASALNNGLVRDFLRNGASMVRLWAAWGQEGYLGSEHRWRKYGTEWLVGGLVPILAVAGYRRLFVLLDEFEKIYMYQSARKRDEFLDVLRQSFYERDSAAVRRRFISTVLTIHPSIYEYLNENWKRVGLEHLAPLDEDHIVHCSVELGASDIPKLTHLLITYLDHFRMEPGKLDGTLHPFEDGALDAAMEKAKLYPRGTLLLAHHVLKCAAKDQVEALIGPAFVEQVIKGYSPVKDEEDEMFDLPRPETDLRG